MAAGLSRRVGRLPYLPALDGIRALAVLAVLLYHGDVIWVPGGFLGVEVFFVLSGFLITSLLWTEMAERNGLDVRDFWIRRARRLLPALGALLVGVSVAFLVAWPGDVASMRGEVPAAAGYVSNWYQIGADHSYFESLGRPSPLQHLWSLAIEEQFYVVWPLILGGLALTVRRHTRIAGIVASAAVLSSAAMWLLHSGGDPSRIYYGTDTRAAGLLLGAALAIVWRPYALARDELWMPARALDAAFAGAAGFLVWAFMRWDGFESFTFRPGIHLVAVASAVLVAVAVHPHARLARLFAWGPLRALGRRSYSIYLWHWPVFVVTRPGVDLDMPVGRAFAIRMAITLVLAELSFRFVEEPARRGAIGRLLRRMRDHSRPELARRLRLGTVSFGLVLLTIVGGLSGAVAVAPEADRAVPAGATDDLRRAAEAPDADLTTTSPTGATVRRSPSAGSPSARTRAITPPPTVAFIEGKVVAVGDSVMLGARSALRERIPTLHVDANVARQVGDGLDTLRALRAAGGLGEIVVVHLGNNGRFTDKQFDAMMAILSDVRRVIVVTVKVPRRWESQVNKTIDAGVKRHPRAVRLDWNNRWRTCTGGRIWAADGFHLTPAGARCYARNIAKLV